MFSATSASEFDYLLYAEDTTYPVLDLIEKECESPNGKGVDEGLYTDDLLATSAGEDDTLFLERLDKFLESQNQDLESFANREGRSLLEIQQRVAIVHAKFLFSKRPHLNWTGPQEFNDLSDVPSVESTLASIHRAINTLHLVSGHDGFVIIVSPDEPDLDPGWLGGTIAGKEYWKGVKGGDIVGAKALRTTSKTNWETRRAQFQGDQQQADGSRMSPFGGKSTEPSSLNVKVELNAAMRNALRETSGDPTAQMRWTKPDQLDYVGVQLLGWPDNIKMQNPSNNRLADNKRLLEMLKRGEIRFVKKPSPPSSSSNGVTPTVKSPHVIASKSMPTTSRSRPRKVSSAARVVADNPPAPGQSSFQIEQSPPYRSASTSRSTRKLAIAPTTSTAHGVSSVSVSPSCAPSVSPLRPMDTLNQGGMSIHDLSSYDGTVSPHDTVAVMASQRESGKRKRGSGVDVSDVVVRKKHKGAKVKSVGDAG